MAAVLAGYLLWIATRGPRVRTGGSLVGWPTETFLAIAAATVGYGSHGLGAPAAGPALAAAAGFALAALAVLPVVTGRDILRIGLGLGLLLGGALLVRTSLGGTPDPIEQLMTAGLVATLGGAVAILAIAARSDGGSGFELSATTPASRPRVRAHPADTHPARRPPRCRPGRRRRPNPMSLSSSSSSRASSPASRSASGRARASSTRSASSGWSRRWSRPSSSSRARSWSSEGGGLATTAYLRLFLILGSLVGLGLAVDRPRRRLAPRRAGRHARRSSAAGGLTLGLVDPRAAVLAATAGGLFGVLVTLLPTNGRAGATVGIRETRAVDRRRRAGDRRDGLVRARPEPAGGPAGRLRAGLPGLRGRGRHAVRGDPVPPVGGAAQRCRARGRPADPDRARPGHRSRSSRWPGSDASVAPLLVDLEAESG